MAVAENKNVNGSRKRFGNLNSVFVGMFAAFISGVFFHFLLSDVGSINKVGMPYLPYVMAFFVGTTVTGLCLKITVTDGDTKN